MNALINFTKKISSLYWKKSFLLQISESKCDKSKIIIGPDLCKNFSIKYPSNLEIGENTVFNGNLYLNCEGGVTIGNFCHIAQGLTLYSSNHDWKSTKYVPYGKSNICKRVIIGNAVWICANVTILPGVEIGNGAIIGAGSVVRKNVKPGHVVTGNPAITIAERNMNLFNSLYKRNLCV
jgi:acetyltransferase-like isoleucine patch superfamily enzyme